MNPIQRAFLKTPIGYIEIAGSEKGIKHLYFLDFRVKIVRTPAVLKDCATQLEEYFHGTRQTFDLKLDLDGTEFQLQVWNALQSIPFGKTITYHDLASTIGNSNALRAVGHANGSNPISIIVPCHRVIGHDGKLVGYRAGLKRKKWLLEHEHAFIQRDLFYGKA
ncbi:MAG: methylated-DNA--[protein]-cysteine S-methyltransferase [Bacteroidales bacterium]|nr:methylated-DNA--[protein]-cysteine S-methyltransferase [Bacteroidales bacterium]HNW73775.1 methylated-DNA--[protein]-cysteine S-methyltransferase [Bacteroidales bacterium]